MSVGNDTDKRMEYLMRGILFPFGDFCFSLSLEGLFSSDGFK